MSTTKIRSFDDFLALFPESPRKKIAGGFKVLCPTHADRDPSLSLTLKGSTIGVKDFGGCPTEDILKAKGLSFSDLFLNSHQPQPDKRTPQKLVATFSSPDATGQEQYQIRRFEPKNFQAWHKNKSGEYVSGLGEAKPIPYRLPELLQAIKLRETVFLPEGEGKADRLVALGLTATSSPFGAGEGKWLPAYNPFFVGVDVVILPDNDPVGIDFAQEKARNLITVAKSVKVLLLPNLPPKGDIIDWLDNGGDIEQLKNLVASCPDYEPSDNGVKLRCMADVKAEAVSWLWQPYIPKGKVTLVEGDPGIGKSWVTLAIATAVTLGKGLPGQEATEPANVVMASAEDGLGDTIKPRLDAMGADVSHIFAIDGALTLDENGFTLLESYLERERPALLIIDPLVAYLGAGVDIHRANETRAVMSQLARLAEKFDIAILAVRHLTKGGMSKAIYRGLGSIDFTAACRSVLLAGCDSANPQNRALVHIKSNLAPTGPAIGYELRDNCFYWTGESTLTAAQILAADNGAGTSESDEAVDFLKDKLADGAVPAKDIYRAAQDTGSAKRTLERAKAKLQVKSRKTGDTWFWCSTESTSPTSPIKEFGDLNQIEAKKEVETEGLGDLDCETVLGMPISEALKIWTVEGAPVIHLGPGENCEDLEKLLSRPDVKPAHLKAVADWLKQRSLICQKN